MRPERGANLFSGKVHLQFMRLLLWDFSKAPLQTGRMTIYSHRGPEALCLLRVSQTLSRKKARFDEVFLDCIGIINNHLDEIQRQRMERGFSFPRESAVWSDFSLPQAALA
jgi:hypothetical protein